MITPLYGIYLQRSIEKDGFFRIFDNFAEKSHTFAFSVALCSILCYLKIEKLYYLIKG